MTDPKLAAARARADAAKARLLDTAHELQYRLKPGTIAAETTAVIKRKSGEMADDAADVVKRRPIAVSATVAGIGALLGAGLFATRGKKDRKKT